MIAAYHTWRRDNRYKRYDRERTWKHFQEELGKT